MNKLFDIEIDERPGSLAFSTDAFLLFAMLPQTPKKRACELGTGSGAIALLAASRGKFGSVDAVEIQSVLAESARSNAEKNGLAGKVNVINADIKDLPTSMNGRYDAVFFNPPYLKNDSLNTNSDEADRACRHEIYGGISDFCSAAARLLKNGGDVYTVYRPERTADLLYAMKSRGLEPKRMITVFPSESDKPCLILVKAKKGASSGMIFERPLYIYKDKTNKIYRDDFAEIYESGVIGNELSEGL